ncbi:MAG: alpha-galactosidase [Caldilineaceae bacterium]|nr:alpha-galactosidase [Caldilineaceae bacterium]
MRVSFNAQALAWDVTWDGLTYSLQLSDGVLLNRYFGPSAGFVQAADTIQRSFPFRNNLWKTRNEATVSLAEGDQPVRWALGGWSEAESGVTILLKGRENPVACDIHLSIDQATGIVQRRNVVRHTGRGRSLKLSQAGSMALLLPSEIDRITYLCGVWGAETQVRSMALDMGPLQLESRSGKTSFEFSPYVALHAPDHTYVFELFWSGNWQIYVNRLGNRRIALTAGLNDWGLAHMLEPGASLELPEAVVACVMGDHNLATQKIHDLRRSRRPDRTRSVPVQFNSWYPYQGEPPVEKMKEFARDASEVGCELFVLDAGWYTTESEDDQENWWTRTGDWVVNSRLFPNGLEELSDYCSSLGLGFGIWFEPEAVSPNGVVWRAHPEWLHHVGGVAPAPDQRAILNLGVPDARAFARDRILSVLQATGAKWMKWDFNTDLLQGGWAPTLPDSLVAQDPLIAHYTGLYMLQDELRQSLPNLTLEMCAGGGGRFDGNILSHAHTNWMSDQTQALINLAIHFGSHLAHAPVECNDWLIEWPPHDGLRPGIPADLRGDLPFRTRVAMLGTFGISAPMDRWTAEDRACMTKHISWYKDRVRPLVETGRQFILTDAPPTDGNGDWAAIWYASRDTGEGCLFAFRLAGSDAKRTFALPGLDISRQYQVVDFDGQKAESSGLDLTTGFTVQADQPFTSRLIHFVGL